MHRIAPGNLQHQIRRLRRDPGGRRKRQRRGDLEAFNPYTSIEFKETPVIIVGQLTPNVGGILRLWMGVTITVAVEVIEMLYDLVASIYRAHKKIIS